MIRAVTIGIIAIIIAMGISLGVNCGGHKGAPPTEVPTAEFTASKTDVAVGQVVDFTDQSTGTPTEWLWDFGDDNTSTEQNPSHAYSSMGSYTVSLTVSNAAGSDTETKQDYVSIVGAPGAQFIADKTQAPLGQEIHFTDQSTGTPTEWVWDFGDGNTSTERNPSHAYSSMGSYTVNLTVSSATGSDNETKENYVLVSEPLEKPITEIRQAIASREGVTEDDIDVLYCEPTTMECDHFAVGAIISHMKSMAFVYDAVGHQIAEIEVEYTAATEDEIAALSCASKYMSKWTGNRILPCEFTSIDGAYGFKYYDGYYLVLDRWSFGRATVDLDTAVVEWGAHV